MATISRQSATALDAAATPIGLRERNKIAKYRRILEAGRALFNEHGYEATTTQAVAMAAGIGVGTLFSYVSTKEDLLIIVFMDDLQEAVQAARHNVRPEDPLLDRILTLYDGLLQYHIGNFALSRCLMREVVNVASPTTREKVSDLMKAIHESVIGFIAAEQDGRGYARSVDKALLSANCFAIYYDVLQNIVDEGVQLADVGNVLRARMRLQIEPFYDS